MNKNWSKNSWRKCNIRQQPIYDDAKEVVEVEEKIKKLYHEISYVSQNIISRIACRFGFHAVALSRTLEKRSTMKNSYQRIKL